MTNQFPYQWLQFADKTYIEQDHKDFEAKMEEYKTKPKETKDWLYVASIYPPSHYNLKTS